MATIIERPTDVSFSKNDIRYVFGIDNIQRPGLFLQVSLFYGGANEVPGSLFYTWNLKPGQDGRVYFSVQSYLDSLLTYQLPQFTDTQIATAADSQAKKFVVEFREIDDINTETEWDVTERNLPYPIVIKGGIERNKFYRDVYFGYYISQNRPFLTWQPNNRYIFDDEIVYLTFFNKAYTVEGLKIILTYYNTVGISETKEVAFSVDGYIQHINIKNLRNNAPTSLPGQLWYFEVKIVDAEDTLLAASYRYYIEYRPLYYYHDLFYHNSLGGFDKIRVKGDTDESFDREIETGEGGLDLQDGYVGSLAKSRQTTHSSILLRRSYKGDAGYMRSREEQESYMEILASKSVWQMYEGASIKYWVPVLSINKSQSLGIVKEPKKSFPLEWQLSDANEVFTPLNFGKSIQNVVVPKLWDFRLVKIENINGSNADATFAFNEQSPQPGNYTIAVSMDSPVTQPFLYVVSTSPTTIQISTRQPGINISGRSFYVKIRANYTPPGEWSPTILITVP